MVLFFITMKRQIKHMIRYKYVPFSFGKKVSLALSLYQIPCVCGLVVPVVHMGSGMLAIFPHTCQSCAARLGTKPKLSHGQAYSKGSKGGKVASLDK